MNNKKIGIFISELRKEKKLTQEELGEKLFVDRSMVSKWERGVYIPSTDTLLKMQELFDVSINEILYGERKNNKNKDIVNAIPLEIIKEEKRNRKKIILFSSIVCLMIILIFFIYYFINNYNSIKLYKISAESDDVIISNGLFIYSKEKSYIRVGDIKSNKKVDKIKLFFINNNKNRLIFEGGESDSQNVLSNSFDYNELFEYSDIKYILNSLKLEITFEDKETIILDLNLDKDYSNDKIVNEYKKPIGDGEIILNNTDISEYVKNNFSFDESTESYLRMKDNVKEEVFYSVGVYIVTIKGEEIEEKYFYYFTGKILEYNRFNSEQIIDNYIYNLETNKCELGICNIDNINNIIENYISQIV